tara:strand:- start:306 stop:629 length:324 start_codon:yes stop_codon:yes gene_type:complete
MAQAKKTNATKSKPKGRVRKPATKKAVEAAQPLPVANLAVPQPVYAQILDNNSAVINWSVCEQLSNQVNEAVTAAKIAGTTPQLPAEYITAHLMVLVRDGNYQTTIQ